MTMAWVAVILTAGALAAAFVAYVQIKLARDDIKQACDELRRLELERFGVGPAIEMENDLSKVWRAYRLYSGGCITGNEYLAAINRMREEQGLPPMPAVDHKAYLGEFLYPEADRRRARGD